MVKHVSLGIVIIIKEPNCNVKHQIRDREYMRNLDTTIIYNYLMKFQMERLNIK